MVKDLPSTERIRPAYGFYIGRKYLRCEAFGSNIRAHGGLRAISVADYLSFERVRGLFSGERGETNF